MQEQKGMPGKAGGEDLAKGSQEKREKSDGKGEGGVDAGI